MKSKSLSINNKKRLTYSQATRRYKRLTAFGDTDRDGVVNMFDCRPFDKSRDGVYNINSKKAKGILNNKRYLYHKTEYSNIPSIIKKESLQIGNKPYSMSELSNPTVVFKQYKQHAVIVLEKKHLQKLRKIDYDKPHESASSHQILQVLFKEEKEWLAEGPVPRKAIKGVILNEREGKPTRYLTDEDMIKTKFKGTS